MNNTEKKLDALIDALGFDVKAVSVGNHELIKAFWDRPAIVQEVFDYKLTKRDSPKRKPKEWKICHVCKGSGLYEAHKASGFCTTCTGKGKVLT